MTAQLNPPEVRRGEVWLVSAVSVLLALGFAWFTATEYRFFGDTEHYVTMAREIASGKAIREGSWLHSFFPPGAPLLLSPAALAFHGSFAAISRWAAVLGSLVFPLTWWYVRRRSRWLAWPIAILTVGSIPFLDLVTDNPMSDVIFLAVTLALLIWAEQHEREAATAGRVGWGSTLLGCVLLVAMPVVRSVGVIAIAAAGLALGSRLVLRKPEERRVTLREAIPFLVALGVMVIWYFGLQRERGYIKVFTLADPMHPDLGPATVTQLLTRPAREIVTELNNLILLMLPGIPLRLTWFTPFLLVVPAIVVGWWRELRGAGRFAALYCAGYVAFLLIWSYVIGPRYLLGVVPLLWVFLFGGVEEIVRAIRADRRWLRFAALGYASCAMLGLLLLRTGILPGTFGLQNGVSLIVWLSIVLVLALGWGPLVGIARRVTLREVKPLVVLGAVAFALLSTAQTGPMIVRRANGTLPLRGPQKAMAAATSWINTHLSSDARILTSWGSRVHFATGRPTTWLPGDSDPAKYLELEGVRPEYLIILENDSTWIMPNDDQKFAILQRVFPERWKLVQHLEGVSIYSFEPKR
jgi:hypothetical protein